MSYLPSVNDVTLNLDRSLSKSPISSTPRLPSFSKRISRVLTPSFLSPSSKPEIVRPTDFLDGLRGYASLFVFITHAVLPLHPNYRIGFWGNDGKDDYWLTQLPIIRLFHSGLACVHVFFVLSGFSISLKPIKLMRAGAHDAVYDSLASATFRRAARLYLPCAGLLVIILGMVFLGLFDYGNELAMKENWPFLGVGLQPPPVVKGVGGQLKHFWKAWWRWSDPMNPVAKITDMPYSGQLWTIPVELRCSMITWITLMGLGKVKPTLRILFMASLGIWSYCRSHTDPTLFLAGAILAELLLARAESSSASKAGVEVETQKEKYWNWAAFFFGLFLASYPRRGGDKALGWPIFHSIGTLIVGNKGKTLLDFFTTVGPILLVWAVSRSVSLKRMFSTPFAKYLGKISFALYCVHQPLISWFGYRNILFWWSVTGNETLISYELGFAIAFSIQTVITVWAADLFCRLVDDPSVRFARWLEGTIVAS
jgi:peptidoglycan/LPS O-acetylase OafA/YrhL